MASSVPLFWASDGRDHSAFCVKAHNARDGRRSCVAMHCPVIAEFGEVKLSSEWNRRTNSAVRSSQ